MSTGGEVANALVCKTSIRGFNSRPVLHNFWRVRWVRRPGTASRVVFSRPCGTLCTARRKTRGTTEIAPSAAKADFIWRNCVRPEGRTLQKASFFCSGYELVE